MSNIVDVSQQVPCDIMHSSFLGVCRALLSDSKIIPISTYDVINTYLKLIKVPHENFGRKPKDIKQVKMWKASEFQNFILHCFVVLHSVINANTFCLLAVISFVLKIMVSKIITEEDLLVAENMINDLFDVVNTGTVISRQHLTSNFHDLIHFCSERRKTGPAFEVSADVFEDNINQLKKRAHGTISFANQVAQRYTSRRMSMQKAKSGGPLDFLLNSRKRMAVKYWHSDNLWATTDKPKL